jgi:hypothetical protein
VTFWAYLRFYLLLWTLCASWPVLRWLVTAAVLIAAAPITLVAAVALTGRGCVAGPRQAVAGCRLAAPATRDPARTGRRHSRAGRAV